jgi:hypothetical protein
MYYLGIDPGKTGGFAQINDSNSPPSVWVSNFPMAGDELDIGRLAWLLAPNVRDTVCACVEKSQSMPGQGVSSVFSYGAGYGKVLGILGTLGIRIELVPPQRWKKVILAGFDLSGDTPAARRKANKQASLAWAARAYPGTTIKGDGQADALAIADFCRRTFQRQDAP